jgi:hypothetical protein
MTIADEIRQSVKDGYEQFAKMFDEQFRARLTNVIKNSGESSWYCHDMVHELRYGSVPLRYEAFFRKYCESNGLHVCEGRNGFGARYLQVRVA